MLEFIYGKKLPDKDLLYYREILINKFGREYDIKSNRLWNFLKPPLTCLEFDNAKELNFPSNVFFYLERQNVLSKTTFEDICKYVDELEPWEYIDAYIFDETIEWLLAITHEELKCLAIGITEK